MLTGIWFLDEFAETIPNVPKEQRRPLKLQSTSELTTTQGVGCKPRNRVVADAERHFKHLEELLSDREWLIGQFITYADSAVTSQVNALLYATETRSTMSNKTHIRPWLDRVDSLAQP